MFNQMITRTKQPPTLLNKSNIDKLPNASSGKYEVSDTKLSGFKLYIHVSGKKIYYVRYTYGKVRRNMKIGEHGLWTAQKARKRAEEIIRLANSGLDPQEERRSKRDIPLFRELSKEYISQLTKKDTRSDISKINNVINPCWGNRQISTIATKDINKILNSRIKKGNTPSTRNRYRSCIHKIFAYAIEQEYLQDNPASRTKRLPENNHAQRCLKPHELNRLVTSLDEVGSINASNAIKMLAVTGQRVREILQMKWEHIDFENRTAHIPVTKNGKKHHAQLPTAAFNILSAHKDWLIETGKLSDYVFPARNGEGHVKCVKRCWYDALKEADLEGLRLHDLRHSFASWAINNGASLYDVMHLLNHSTPQMTTRYAHLLNEKLSEAAENATKGMNVIPLDNYRTKSKQPQTEVKNM